MFFEHHTLCMLTCHIFIISDTFLLAIYPTYSSQQPLQTLLIPTRLCSKAKIETRLNINTTKKTHLQKNTTKKQKKDKKNKKKRRKNGTSYKSRRKNSSWPF